MSMDIPHTEYGYCNSNSAGFACLMLRAIVHARIPTRREKMQEMKPPRFTSEVDAIRILHQRGFTADFEAREGILRDTASGRQFHPEELSIVEHHRFEGASNPDDMSVIYAIESGDGVKGLLVDAFGVYADPRIAALLEKIKSRESSKKTRTLRLRKRKSDNA